MNRLKMSGFAAPGYEVLSFPSCIGHNRAGTGSEGPKAESQRGSGSLFINVFSTLLWS
jgi:hypothetical protein